MEKTKTFEELVEEYSNEPLSPIDKEEPIQFYVNKMPKNCFECPCFSNSIECGCNLSDGSEDFFKFDDEENCPLKLVKDYKNGDISL